MPDTLNDFMTDSPITLEITCGGVKKEATRTSNTTEVSFPTSLIQSSETKCNSIVMRNNSGEKIDGTFVRPDDGELFDDPTKAVVGWFSQEIEFPVYSNTPDSLNTFLAETPVYMILTCAGITKTQERNSNTTMFKLPSVAFEYSETKCTKISLENNKGEKLEGTFVRPDDSVLFDHPDTAVVGWW